MSLLVIEVHSEETDHRSGISKTSGKQWDMYEQEVWLRFPNSPYPEKMKINLNSDLPQAVKKGIYKLDPTKVCKIGNFGSLEIDDRKIPDAMEFHSPLPKKAEAS